MNIEQNMVLKMKKPKINISKKQKKEVLLAMLISQIVNIKCVKTRRNLVYKFFSLL